MGDDNVIPFPGGRKRRSDRPRRRPSSLAHLVQELLASGRSPQELYDETVRALPSLGFSVEWDEPTLLDPPAQVAAYTVRVDLNGAKPPVWRRLVLAGDLTLDQVHDVLQVALGWTDSHLHQFRMGPGPDNPRMRPFVTAYDLSEGEDEGTPEADVRLDQVLAEVGDRLHYQYDFGDGWEHTLRLERVEEYDGGRPARCTGGRRACPPEDIGGIDTFNEVVAWLAAPDPGALQDPHLVEVVEWLPRDFDPVAFDAGEADAALSALRLR